MSASLIHHITSRMSMAKIAILACFDFVSLQSRTNSRFFKYDQWRINLGLWRVSPTQSGRDNDTMCHLNQNSDNYIVLVCYCSLWLIITQGQGTNRARV